MSTAKKPANVPRCYLIGKFGLIQAFVRLGWPKQTVVVIDYAGVTTDLDLELRGRLHDRDHIGVSFGERNRRYCNHAGDIAVVKLCGERAAKDFIKKLNPYCPVYIFRHGKCVYHQDPKAGIHESGMRAHD
ncbi:MAG: hypothetical protein Q7R85_03120 [bacterium]|nr:hypothetical protein [bacterium]